MRRVRLPSQGVKSERREQERDRNQAVSAFLAGLPAQRGRILTSSSDPDSWRRKHPVIARRLALERAWRLQRAST